MSALPLAVAVTSHSLRLPSDSDVRVAQSFLNLCYLGVVIEGVGGGGGTQGGGTGLEAQSQCISTNEPVDAIGGNSAVEIACSVVPDGPKKVSPPCLAMSRQLFSSSWVSACSGMYRVLLPCPCTRRWNVPVDGGYPWSLGGRVPPVGA
jgi:hypothetical protein